MRADVVSLALLSQRAAQNRGKLDWMLVSRLNLISAAS